MASLVGKHLYRTCHFGDADCSDRCHCNDIINVIHITCQWFLMLWLISINHRTILNNSDIFFSICVSVLLIAFASVISGTSCIVLVEFIKHDFIKKPSATVVEMSFKMYYSFSQLFTHIFWKHASYSQNSTHKSKKNTHNGQNPSIFLQNETLHSKQCYFFSKWDFVFKWHTQTIICIDIYKNQLNTDVLNVKHYDECKTLFLHSS